MVGGAKYVPGQNFYIKVNNHLVDTSNYRLTYKNNRMDGDATVTIMGQKLLTGKTDKTFKINKASLSDSDFNVTAKDVVTSGKDLMVGDLTKANIGITQLVNGRQKKLATRDYDKNNIQYYIDVDGDYKSSCTDTIGALHTTLPNSKRTATRLYPAAIRKTIELVQRPLQS